MNLYAYCHNNPVMYVDPEGNLSFLVFLAAAVIGFVVSFTSSVVSQALFNGGKVDWGIAAIDGLFGAISSALFMIPGLGPVAYGLISAGLTAVNMTITTGIENNWKYDWKDALSIVGSSILSGVISGAGRNKFLNNKGQEVLENTHKQLNNITHRLGSGHYYRSGNLQVGQRAANSAKKHIVKNLINLNFGDGFYKDWMLILLSSIFSTTFSKGLQSLK